MKKILLLIISFLTVLSTQAQNFRGLVLDAENDEPLPFVNIIFNDANTLGTATDINGLFSSPEGVDLRKLSFSYLGYVPLNVQLDTVDLSQNPVPFRLVPEAFDLEEIVIIPGVNPADVLIKKVVANKNINDPSRLESYSLTTYNKTIYDLMPNDEVNKLLARDAAGDTTALASDEEMSKLLKRTLEKTKDRHLMVLESVTEKVYAKPDKIRETVVANRVSGFRDPSFAPIPANFQPFSFYTEYIQILEDEYINPISRGSTKRYFFNLEDTLVTANADSVFILSFRPKRGKNFKALSGVIYINTDGYALQNIIAEPHDKGAVYARLQQVSKKVDGQWFPDQINFEVLFENMPSKQVGMKLTGKTYIKDVKINPAIDADVFGVEQMVIAETAADKKDDYWVEQRVDTLSIKEQQTYKEMDALGNKLKLDFWVKAGAKITQGLFPAGPIDIYLNRLFYVNQIDGVRLGFGGETNEKVSKWFNVGGFFGYGFKDKQWKYGGLLRLNLQEENEISLQLEASRDLLIAGQSGLDFPAGVLDIRNYLVANLDRAEEIKATFKFRSFKYLKSKFYFSRSRLIPTYQYTFLPPEYDRPSRQFDISEVGVKMRFAYKERLVQSLGRRVSRGTDFPIFYLTYSRGLNNVLGGEFGYNRLELGMTQSIRIKGWGKSWIRLEGGIVDRAVPYSKLFLSSGNFSQSVPFFVYYTFQTMRIFEFLSDRYAHLFWVHDFGTLLVNRKKFKPEVKFVQAIGYGQLSNAQSHDLNPDLLFENGFKTLEKGYFESGIILANLVRFNLMNVAYFGIGAGAFYRYGPYAYDREIQNFAFKASFYFSTN